MRSKIFFAALALLVVAVGAWVLLRTPPVEESAVQEVPEVVPVVSVVGTSVEGRNIEMHTFGTGNTELLFVGGIHGGYEWNSVVLAYEMIDYLKAQLAMLPANITVRVIPNLNPDAVFAVVQKEGRFAATDVPPGEHAAQRFNANGADLNRNFDCKWKPQSSWRGNIVSAGTEPFSEPEAQALQKVVATHAIDAVVFWHSQANAVYASECEEGVLPRTITLMNTYANAAGYTAIESFDAYPVSGDAEGWLASIGVPAITVELSSHEAIEFNKNRAGVEAVITTFAAE